MALVGARAEEKLLLSEHGNHVSYTTQFRVSNGVLGLRTRLVLWS